MKKSKNYIGSLQVLRALGFLAIFSAHAGITRLGAFGVSLFFVLSGFVLAYSYNNEKKVTGTRNVIVYVLNKIKRLYPLHVLMLILAIPIAKISLSLRGGNNICKFVFIADVVSLYRHLF